MSRRDTDISTPAARNATAFDPLAALDGLLSDVGLSRAETGGAVSFAGQDPILPAAHRLGACIGIPIMAGAVAAVAFHRHRGGPGQDLELDLRQAVHGINPAAFWHPTLNGELAPHPLVLDNPFLLTPYRTADGRWVMASGVYPHLAAKWCRFLDVPPDAARVAAAIQRWDAFELEEAANAAGLPACVIRAPRRMAGAPAGSAPGQPAGDRPGAHRRRPGTRLRPGAAAIRRHPRTVVHSGRRGPGRGPDPGRARRGRALRDPSERLRTRIHLRRGQRRLPQRLPRPREPRRAGTSGRPAGRGRHRGQQPPQRLAGTPWPRATPTRRTVPGPGVRLSHLLRITRTVGRTRRLRHERIRRLRPHDHGRKVRPSPGFPSPG